jgi:hypothetical protein
MCEKKYMVWINKEVVARGMDLRTATVLVKALFDEYYNDHNMMVSIKEEAQTVCQEG